MSIMGPSAFDGLPGEGRSEGEQAYVGGFSAQQATFLRVTPDGAPFYGPPQVVRRYAWTVGMIDLRGDLKDYTAYGVNAARVKAEALLFSHYTFAVSLDVTLPTNALWRFYAVTRSAAVKPVSGGDQQAQLWDTEPVDITTQVYGGSGSTVTGVGTRYQTALTFEIERPVRYWGVSLVADLVQGAYDGSLLAASGGLY